MDHLSFAPINSNNSNSKIKEIDNILSESTEKVSLDSQTVTNIYNECEEEKNIIATYECKDEETSLSYESLEHGLKETIIVDTKPESNIFSFELTLQDMYLMNVDV